MKRIAFLVSGNGTNMENLVREIQAGRVPGQAAVVISDNPRAGALERAKKLGVTTAVVERKDYETKQDFETGIEEALSQYEADLVCLAGFMRILSPGFVERHFGRIVNIHPAYLPEFPGAHAIKDAFEAKVKQTGVTVHFVDAGVDSGPIILQERVAVRPEDTLETLEARIHEKEYRLYPEAVKLVLSGKARLEKM
ncbi:MAG: phosphoribosylglycinamide formyltransferase [Omnitrophica bacterium GWA2_52_8]|nr:MAG: phosphoribosylglycinamide formyltransferase [Omnitrophica bacterium GWA2_52_8]